MWIWFRTTGWVGAGEGQDWFLQVCLLICLNVLRRPQTFNDVLAPPPTTMEEAFGCLHDTGEGAVGARPIVVDSMVVGGEGKTSSNTSGYRKTFIRTAS